MPSFIKEDFIKLGAFLQAGTIPKPDFMLDFSHKFDLVQQKTTFTSALGYKEKPNVTDAVLQQLKLEQGNIPPHNAVVVTLTGPYRYLASGWTAGMGFCRRKKIKEEKKIPKYEVYVRSPADTPEEELLTEIVFPTRK